MKKVLFVAYHFPPSASSGVFRSLGFTRHLAALGWQIQILTVTEKGAESIDRDLEKKIPERVRVFPACSIDPFALWARLRRKCDSGRFSDETTCSAGERQQKKPSFKEVFSHFLKTPDNLIGWLLPALWKARRLEKPDLIYSSAPPFTGHLVACFLKKIWGVPLVCDFRDPWLDNPFRRPRPGLAEAWDHKLEKWVFRTADAIVANTNPMAEALCKRHPEVRSRVSVITNGFDPEDFNGIEADRQVPLELMLLLHPGSLYGQRDPRVFLEGLRIAVFEKQCSRIRVQLMGPCAHFGGRPLEEHLAHFGLEAYVEKIPSVPHAKALAKMKGADILLLLSQGTNLQVPAKIFEYMGLAKAIFAVCEPESATENIMSRLGPSHFSSRNEAAEIAGHLVNAYRQWEKGKSQARDEHNKSGTDIYLRSTLTKTLQERMLLLLRREVL